MMHKRLHRIDRTPDHAFRPGFSRLHFGSIRFFTRRA
jgi:hypothetical protein